ncbi:MAG: cupin domain-containing protein [Rhodothermales bacterium]
MPEPLRFITREDVQVVDEARGLHHWLSRPGLTEAKELLMVRVAMPPGQAHKFHRHPSMEEIIYIVSGVAEQWVEEEFRILEAGEMAHIPVNVVHATYNAGDEPLVFLAILSPAIAEEPTMVDVWHEEPWCSLKPPTA